MASIGTYGSYSFADNEVNLVQVARRTILSPRGKRLQEQRTFHCSGELIYSSTATIISKIAEVENALKDDYKDFTFKIDGTTAHSLLNGGDCASGVRVMQKSFPKGDPAELATTRTFSFTLQATYDNAESDLISWRDSMAITGNGSAPFFILDTAGGPIALFTAPSSAIFYVHSGSAVGYTAYPTPPSPVFGGLTGEMGFRRRRVRHSAKQVGNGLRFYQIEWTYYYVQNQNGQDVLPVSL